MISLCVYNGIVTVSGYIVLSTIVRMQTDKG